MINSIDKLKKFGCFEDFQYNPKEISPFNRINILFGNNGSGKTTLSNLFFLLSKNCKDKSKLQLEYIEKDTDLEISCSFGKVTVKNIESQEHDIYVFNSKFISDHVFNGTTSNVDAFNAEIKLTNELISKIDSRLALLIKRKKKFDIWISNLENKLDESWEEYKDEFQEIVSDARLTNKKPQLTETDGADFDRSNAELESLYANYKKKNAEQSTIEKLSSLTEQVNSILEINLDLNLLNETLGKPVSVDAKSKVQEKINGLQKKISEKKWDGHIGDLNNWLRTGGRLLHISKVLNNSCPLCNTDLSSSIDDIISDYGNYFNDAFNKTISQLEADITSLNEHDFEKNSLSLAAIKVEAESMNIKMAAIDDFEFKKLKEALSAALLMIREKIKNANASIRINEAKISLLNDYTKHIRGFKKNMLKNIQAELKELSRLTKRSITDDIKNYVNKIVKISYNLPSNCIFSLKKRNNAAIAISCIRSLGIVAKEIDKLEGQRMREISKLNAESKFVNYYLECLGIHHFTVNRQKDKTQNNVTITYNKSGRSKSSLNASLSEGEKTALAFAYFISKIRAEKLEGRETGFETCIVVIDDPISSLDDNRLFQTANTIDSFFFYNEAAEDKYPLQFFLLSHNQLFTKYIYTALKSNEKLRPLINEYFLHSNEPNIRKIPGTLKNFTNTYLLKLRELIEYKEKNSPEYEIAKNYLPNYIRIVLETFLSFKLALVNDDQDKMPGLATLITKAVSELRKVADYEMEVDGGNKLNRDAIIKRLNHLKKISDHESHGNIARAQDISFIAEDELKVFVKFTIQVIQYIDSIHISRIKAFQ